MSAPSWYPPVKPPVNPPQNPPIKPPPKHQAQQVSCSNCKGQGSWQEMGEEDCMTCHGTGRDFNSEFWALACNSCGGSGKKTYCRTVTCSTCGGLGYIEVW